MGRSDPLHCSAKRGRVGRARLKFSLMREEDGSGKDKQVQLMFYPGKLMMHVLFPVL